MAVTDQIHLPSPDSNTPTPYRVPTEAVRVWQAPQPTTEQLRTIRASITPNRGWWQFPLPPMPWEAVLAFKVWFATVSIGTLAITAYLALGGHR